MAELKTAYGGQTPKSNDEVNEVDELIQNANRLIESVYRDINMSGISTTQDATNTSNVNMQSSNPTQRQLEIQRIHRFCETIDEEARPVLRRRSPNNMQPADNVRVDMNTTFLQDDTIDNSVAASIIEATCVQRNTIQARRTSTTNPNGRRSSTTEPNSGIILNTAFLHNEGRANRNSLPANSNATANNFIDLSNAPSTISIESTQGSRRENVAPTGVDEDDDVIIVSCDLIDVVDLCTPVRDGVNLRPAVTTNTSNNTNRRPINRQNRNQANSPSRLSYRSRSPLETVSEVIGSRSVQTSTTHIQQPQQQRQLFLTKSVSSSESAGVNALTSAVSENSLNSSGSGSERSILMCPVCMESSVKRKPTSTKCGHVFCESCIQQALRLTHKCPMCNTKLNNKMLFRIYL